MWVVDLADLDAIDAFAARAVDELGGVDVLVNNAGCPEAAAHHDDDAPPTSRA